MLVWAFQNGLRARHFNEFRTQSSTTYLSEVVTQAEWYIKSEVSNVQKKARDAKEHTTNTNNSQRNQYMSPMRDIMSFKQSGKSTESLTPLNTHWEQIWQDVQHIHNIPQTWVPKTDVIRPDRHSWCKIPKVKGHQTEDCYQLKKELKHLIEKVIWINISWETMLEDQENLIIKGNIPQTVWDPRRRRIQLKESMKGLFTTPLSPLYEDSLREGIPVPPARNMLIRFWMLMDHPLTLKQASQKLYMPRLPFLRGMPSTFTHTTMPIYLSLFDATIGRSNESWLIKGAPHTPSSWMHLRGSTWIWRA